MNKTVSTRNLAKLLTATLILTVACSLVFTPPSRADRGNHSDDHPVQIAPLPLENPIPITVEEPPLINADIPINQADAATVSVALAAKEKRSRCKHARYKAKRIGNSVIVVAYGAHTTSGYRTEFRKLKIEPHPPQFEFLEQKPSGSTLQVITPFARIAHFRTNGIEKIVVIHDGNGKHSVRIAPDPAGKARPRKPGVNKQRRAVRS